MMNNEDWKISMRPTNIDDYMGNPPFQKFYREVIIPKKDIPLSILFQGQFGCGKTTAAKLVASTLVCQHPNKDGSPCCKCPSCRSILDNKFDRDVKFINGGASGKDDIVDGISKFVVGRPMFDGRKIMIIDEVQQLSTAALNALLIAMETTRNDVTFLFTAMSDLKAGGFKSRCRTFLFRQPSVEELANLEIHILKEKNLWDNETLPFEFKTEGLQLIAKSAEGSYRTVVGNLQQCVDTKTFNLDEIQAMFEVGSTAESDVAIVNLLTGKFRPEDYDVLVPKKGYTSMIEAVNWLIVDTGKYNINGELCGLREKNFPMYKAIIAFNIWKFLRDEMDRMSALSYVPKSMWENAIIKTAEYAKSQSSVPARILETSASVASTPVEIAARHVVRRTPV